ncbi:hypothetical protein [Sedimentitalea todarodis]|uniref:Stability/partitioning determinant n=1 Tax=Sedimentitalea todarodis TaxID=1631240 RepID=A0ABU3VLD7_9RHOB|nr:hypothetical protein [Sedimentitalea todarodis]MDU9007007.1 hypothetical protein [Sedimentitalea todarodis]
MSKYGFGGGIELPKPSGPSKTRPKVEPDSVEKAVEAGKSLGFVSREAFTRLKPGPKRKEPQDKVSIPGPKRVVDQFRAFCRERNLTLWQGLELLLSERRNESG